MAVFAQKGPNRGSPPGIPRQSVKAPLIQNFDMILGFLLYLLPVFISISAQSNYIVGAVLNATFGSIVEIILYISSLVKQAPGLFPSKGICYSEIVKSALTGTLLVTMLFIPVCNFFQYSENIISIFNI